MKQQLGGYELDLLTADELGRAFGDALSDLAVIGGNRPRRIRLTAAGITDASGNLDLDVMAVPAGHELSVARFVAKASNATAGVPSAVAGAFINLASSDKVIDFFGPAKSGGANLILPVVATWGLHDAPSLRNSEVLQVRVRSYTANTGLTFEVQGWEDRLEV